MVKPILIVCMCSILVVATSNGQENPPVKNIDVASTTMFDLTIRPILTEYCSDCHEPGAMKGIDFLAASTQTELANHRGVFSAVAEQLENGEMPPENCDQPTDKERKMVVDWINKTFDLKPNDTDRISQYVVEVYEDRKGNLWFGTMKKGVGRYDGKSLTWFSTKDGLPSNTAPSFAEDKEGNLWVGTHGGICKFDGKGFATIGKEEGLPGRGGGVSADKDGNIWASMYDGLYRYDGSSFKEFKVPIEKQSTSSYSVFDGRASLHLQDKHGNQWFGTDGHGAIKFDGKSFTQFTKKDGLCSNTINSIVEDKQGNIWFACMQAYQPKMTGDGGVCRYDGKTFTKFPEHKGLSENDIYTIYMTKSGDVWIGASGVGAYRYDGKQFALFSETNRKHWTRKFGLQSMLEDQNGTLWFGFSGGLFRFNGESFYNVAKTGPWK